MACDAVFGLVDNPVGPLADLLDLLEVLHDTTVSAIGTLSPVGHSYIGTFGLETFKGSSFETQNFSSVKHFVVVFVLLLAVAPRPLVVSKKRAGKLVERPSVRERQI